MIQAEGIFAGENLTTVLAEQEALIAEQEAMIINIQTALEGKAGVVAETCMVNVTIQGTQQRFIGVDINGVVYNEASAGTSLTLTMPTRCLVGFTYGGFTITGSCELVYSVGYGIDWYLITGDTTAISTTGAAEPS